jgi:hypothetical protein
MQRDPRQVIAAFQKQQEDEQLPKRPWMAALYYLYVHACARHVQRKLGTLVRRLSYEALLADPIGELEAIESWAGVKLQRARDIVASGGAFEPGHIVTGNRIRRSRQIRFEGDSQPPAAPATSTRMAGCFADRASRLLGLRA